MPVFCDVERPSKIISKLFPPLIRHTFCKTLLKIENARKYEKSKCAKSWLNKCAHP